MKRLIRNIEPYSFISTPNQYVLMNKNNKLCKFSINLYKDIPIGTFNKGMVTDIEYYENIDFNLTDFINSRQPPKHRQHIDTMLKLCQIHDIIGLIGYTHLTSLNDTYWVKESNSLLTWEDVSLYSNCFDEVVAKVAFTGGMYGDQFSSTTPEFGTSGSFAKCWVHHNDKIFMKKLGSTGFANSGLEPFSEYYAQQILEALDINHIKYTLHSSTRGYYTECELFTNENMGYRPCSDYFNDILSAYNGYKSVGLLQDFKMMLIADAIMMNEDRHLGNFGFLVDNITEDILGVAPLFDHNVSLLCYAMDTDLNDLDEYLSNKGHKLLSGDFITSIKEYVDTSIREKLINLQGFEIKPHPEYNLPKERLDILNMQINKQIEDLLGR